MGKGTETQHYKGISISEGTTQHFTGGKTYSPALQPLSAALLTISALRKANFSCPSSPTCWTSSAHTYQRMWARNKPPSWENHTARPCCKSSGLSLWLKEQEILKHHLCCPKEKTICSSKDLELFIDPIQPWSMTPPHKQQQLLEILAE